MANSSTRTWSVGKKAIACLMAVVLVMGLSPFANLPHASAYADDGSLSAGSLFVQDDPATDPEPGDDPATEPVTDPVAKIGEIGYATLQEAFTAAKDGETIVLQKDFTQDDGVELDGESAKSIKFDLNENTLTVNTGVNLSNRAIMITKGTLEAYNGTIDAKDGCYGAFRVEADGNLKAHDLALKNYRKNGLNVKVLGGSAELERVTIDSQTGGGIEVTEAKLGEHSKPGTATLTDCTFTQAGYGDWCSTCLSVSGGSQLTVNSGTYTSENWALYVFSSGGVIDVKGGTFIGAYGDNDEAIRAEIDLSTYPDYTGGLQIEDGTFTGTYKITSPAYMQITGGTFSADPSAYVDTDNYTVSTEGGNYVVKAIPNVAKIGDTEYRTLEAALAVAESGATIELLADIDTSKAIEITESVTIDGKKNESENYKVNSTASRILLVKANDVDLALKNIDFNGNNVGDGRGLQINPNFSNVTMTIDNCSVVGITTYAINVCAGITNSRITISDSYIEGWGALNIWSESIAVSAKDSEFVGVNKTTESSWNNFGTIVFEGDSTYQSDEHSENCSIWLDGCTVTATETNSNLQRAFVFNPQSVNDILYLTGDTTIICGKDRFYKDYGKNSTIAMDATSAAVVHGCIEDGRIAYGHLYDYAGEHSTVKKFGEQVVLYGDLDATGDKPTIKVAYVDFYEPFAGGRLKNEGYIFLTQDVVLDKEVVYSTAEGAIAKTGGTFHLDFYDPTSETDEPYQIDASAYKIPLMENVSALTSQEADVFSAPVGYEVVKSENDDEEEAKDYPYKYSVEKRDDVTVTFDSNGGSAVEGSPFTVQYGATVAKPAADPTYSGRTFQGWLLNGQSFDFSTPVKDDITLVASWYTPPAPPAPDPLPTMTVVAGDVNVTYDGKAHSIVLEGVPAESTVTYRTSPDGEWASTNPTFTEVGEQVVYWRVVNAGYRNSPATGSAKVVIVSADLPEMEGVSAKDVKVEYDGKAHGITVVGAPEGAAVKFGTTEGEYTLDASPTQTDEGELTVFYQVTHKDYKPFAGKAVVIVAKTEQADEDTGVKAEGDTFVDEATDELRVELDVADFTGDAADKSEEAAAIQKEFADSEDYAKVSVYNVDLNLVDRTTGDVKGKLTSTEEVGKLKLTFKLANDKRFDGKRAEIVQLHKDGSTTRQVATFTPVVRDGVAEIVVNQLSEFIIAVNEDFEDGDLAAALVDARAELSAVVTSTDGADLTREQRWATAEDKAALEAVIAQYQSIVDALAEGTFEGDQQDIDDATAAVRAALETFKASELQTVLRLYNPNSGEHFYTTDAPEKDYLVDLGWHDENVGWYAPAYGVDVYRMYNPVAGEHHYTTNAEERQGLIDAGWNDEDVLCCAMVEGGVPLYRVYNPNAHENNHHFTTGWDEYQWLIDLGWNDERIAWNVARPGA